MSRKRIEQLTILLHHRWAVPVLAELSRSSGSKFVTLVRRLGISRDSLRYTLDALVREGWVVRNTGHGHPLRPEYLLSRAATRLGRWCERLMALLSALGVEDMALRKWSMPVALALRARQERFSRLKAALPASTARALTLALKNLQTAGLVERIVSEDYPPATHYRLTSNGRRLAAVLETL